MKIYSIILFSFCMFLPFGCIVSGENTSYSDNLSVLNQTNSSIAAPITPEEELMNLAFEAREFALEKGKDAAIPVFSNPNGPFYKDNNYIIAYAMDGTLLANPNNPSDTGTSFISDDYDSGNVRLMRDMAASGGGLFTDQQTGNFWFVFDVDGSWWICASRITNQDQ